LGAANHEVEVMAVFQGLCMLKEMGINVATLVGDYSIIIQALFMRIAP
jgi:ribonuclease HI